MILGSETLCRRSLMRSSESRESKLARSWGHAKVERV